MKKLIVFIGLLLCMNAFADSIEEPSWKASLRNYLNQFLGQDMTIKLLGEPPIEESILTMEMPPLPEVSKSSTDLKTYEKDEKYSQYGKEYLSQSKEKLQAFDLAFVQELFWASRGTRPTDEDVEKWMNALEQGASREGIYRALVLDEVYATLENYDSPSTESLIKFMSHFSKEYLGLSYKEETLKKTNLFMLKRILSERILELLDAYVDKPENLFQWYSVVSAHLGTHFSSVLKNSMRRETDPYRHLSWCKSVPLQHVKMELIIKVHLIMNSLQNT